MPLFDYETPDGKTVELLLTTPTPHVVRDGQVLRRKAVQPFAIAGVAPIPTLGSQVLRGYYNEECRNGARFHSKLPAETVKRTWANDTHD